MRNNNVNDSVSYLDTSQVCAERYYRRDLYKTNKDENKKCKKQIDQNVRKLKLTLIVTKTKERDTKIIKKIKQVI